MSEVELLQAPDERVMTRVFGGYSRFKAPVPSKAGYTGIDLADCMNMASEQYPCAWVREPRRTVYMEDKATGAAIALLPGKMLDCINHGGTLAYLLSDGSVMCGKHRWSWSDGKTLTRGRIYQFGAGIFCPDTNMYIPNVNEDVVQKLSVGATAVWKVVYTNANGDVFPEAVEAASAPASPSDGSYYFNTTDKKLYQYNDGSWEEITTGYFHDTTNDGVYEYDGTEWDAMEIHHMLLFPTIGSSLSDFARYTAAVLWMTNYMKVSDHIIVEDAEGEESIGAVNISNLLKTTTTISGVTKEYTTGLIIDTIVKPEKTGEMTVSRAMPYFDYAVVHDNRVWACRHGTARNGQFVNEIYACRQGDPTNWNVYEGISDDAFTARCGEPGDWTGAAVVGDNVVFFKEHCMYTIYGDTPATYTVKLDYCSGVEKGSDKSVALINGYTYYNSPHGIMRLYTGTLPVKISDELMFKQTMEGAVGGTDGRKYYMHGWDERSQTLRMVVYDTELQEWHIESALTNDVMSFVKMGGDLMAVYSSSSGSFYKAVHRFISPPYGERRSTVMLYLCYLKHSSLVYPDDAAHDYEAIAEPRSEVESNLRWSFTTGNFGLNEPDYKRVKSIAIRAWLDTGASFKTEIMYDDDGTWHELEASRTFSGGETGTNRVEYRLRRCDLYRLRISGHGRACIYSITHTYEGDGNRSYGSDTV